MTRPSSQPRVSGGGGVWMGGGTTEKRPRLLICADSGGSNGNRTRACKLYLQALSDETGMAITVCHYPPGTSKWNTIEHRLFSFISLNWKGKPLVNYETVINLIGGTRTRSGLKVKAVLDTNLYETGVEISRKDIDQLRLKRHKVHPDWITHSYHAPEIPTATCLVRLYRLLFSNP